MSCISRKYNFTVKWLIENVSVFLNQMGGSFCVPEVEVETLSTTKWIFTLCKVNDRLEFRIRKAVMDNTSTSKETVIDLRVSFVGLDESLYLSNIGTDLKFQDDSTAKVGTVYFQLEELLERKKYLFPKGTATMRIEMRYCDSNPLILCSTIRTKMKVETFSFACSVKELNDHREGQSITFPIAVYLRKAPNFNLQFQQSILDDFSENRFVLYKRSGYQDRRLLLDDQTTPDDCGILLHVKISTKNSRVNRTLISQWLFFVSSRADEKRPVPDSELGFLPSDDVTCEFLFADGSFGTLLEERDYSHPVHQIEISSVSNSCYLGKSLFKDDKFLDVILKVGKKTFKAHKAVLSSVSPVFRAMFRHEMTEQDSGVVCIEDVDPDTLERLLRFVYTDALVADNNFEAVAKLFAAADKYAIHSLKSECSSRLVSMLCSENVCRAFHLAYMHDDEEMQEAAKIAFCKDPVKVMNSEGWKTFIENCIRGRTTKESFPSFLFPQRLRRSISRIGERIQRAHSSKRETR